MGFHFRTGLHSGDLNTSGFLNQHPRHSGLGKHLGKGELRRHPTPSGLRPSIVAVSEVIANNLQVRNTL